MSIGAIQTMQVEQLEVRVYADRPSMGRAAAGDVATAMLDAIREQGRVRMAFAAAPSQSEFLAALVANPEIPWDKVTAFQLDEYVGLDASAPQTFGSFLRSHLFDEVQPGELHLVGITQSAEEAAARSKEYAALIGDDPLDVVCIGIGENGHLAFNDPPVADFEDPETVKLVELDSMCRQQQVNDGAFATYDDVPTHAITLTIPTLVGGRTVACMVPGAAKRPAVAAALNGPITTECPASILRRVPACTLYLDPESYGA